jgi:hypothetical protein
LTADSTAKPEFLRQDDEGIRFHLATPRLRGFASLAMGLMVESIGTATLWVCACASPPALAALLLLRPDSHA